MTLLGVGFTYFWTATIKAVRHQLSNFESLDIPYPDPSRNQQQVTIN
jgi:hypothetical protein